MKKKVCFVTGSRAEYGLQYQIIRKVKSSKFLNSNGYNNQSINFIKKLKIKNKINVNLDNDILFKLEVM